MSQLKGCRIARNRNKRNCDFEKSNDKNHVVLSSGQVSELELILEQQQLTEELSLIIPILFFTPASKPSPPRDVGPPRAVAK